MTFRLKGLPQKSLIDQAHATPTRHCTVHSSTQGQIQLQYGLRKDNTL